jgi:hypothetical protein
MRHFKSKIRVQPGVGDIPGINIIVGAAIIVASSLIVILRERYLARHGKLKRAPTGTQPPKAL